MESKMEMTVINIDCNGEIIEDMSKIVLPPELNELICRMLMRKDKKNETTFKDVG